MNNYTSYFSRLALTATIITTNAFAAPKDDMSKFKPISSTQNDGKCSLTATIEKPCTRESATLHLQLKNIGTEPIVIRIQSGLPAFPVYLKDRKANLCPYTGQGEARYEYEISFSSYLQKLSPGESKTWTVDLEKLFQLTVDTWTVNVIAKYSIDNVEKQLQPTLLDAPIAHE